jgi:acyl-CoA synthetase (AMP-forming)/AMP-acid ligase II
MGDLGYFDAEGRLWFCGRKSQRVVVDAAITLCTEQVEPVFNAHPGVRRSALVGIGPRGAQRAVLVYELEGSAGSNAGAGTNARRQDRRAVPGELRAIAARQPHTATIAAFMRYPKPFPVDIRHNAKIGREALAAWAARQPQGDRA